jgi:hypothetical protein
MRLVCWDEYGVIGCGPLFLLRFQKLPKFPPDDIGGFEQMTCGEVADNFVMPNCGESHGGYAATLRAIGFPAELARGNYGFQIGRDAVSGTSKYTVRGGLWGIKEFLDQGLMHVENGIEGTKAEELRNDSGTERRRKKLRSCGA